MSSGWTPINVPLTTNSKVNIKVTVKTTGTTKPVKTTVKNSLKPKSKMPPKVAATSAEGSSNSKAGKTEKVVDDELKLTWALICQMSSGGKLVGVNWEEVQAQIEAPTKHAAYLRWDSLKKRMKSRGLELPTDRTPAEAKAKVTKTTPVKPPKAPKDTPVKKPRGKKAKEAEEAAASEEAEAYGGSEEAQNGAENESS